MRGKACAPRDTLRQMMEADRPRIAIVGCGPRALWAVESLDRLVVDRSFQTPASVTVFGLGPLGVSPAYAIDQPDYLRLNVTSEIVDAWCGNRERGPSLDGWRAAQTPGAVIENYPPRWVVGRYLADQAANLLAATPLDLTHRREWVSAIERDVGGWWINSTGPFTDVLLATGHGQHATPRPTVRPGFTIAIRGAALTAIDVVLALSIGRGFTPSTMDVNVVLCSRSGLMMMPKPEPSVSDAALARVGDLTPHLAAAADPTIDAYVPLCEVTSHITGVSAEALSPELAFKALISRSGSDPVAAVRGGIAMATGQAEPDIAWALGQAWRLLYGGYVERQAKLGQDATHPLNWPWYRQWARELERVAFGPPLVNARLLLEGLESGRVTVLRGGVDGVRNADLVVDAVIEGPGVAELPADDLLRQIPVTCRCGFRGARVAADAQLLDSDGRPVPGLSLVGRATEDEVIGNDTLNRQLHSDIERWAERVLRAV